MLVVQTSFTWTLLLSSWYRCLIDVILRAWYMRTAPVPHVLLDPLIFVIFEEKEAQIK